MNMSTISNPDKVDQNEPDFKAEQPTGEYHAPASVAEVRKQFKAKLKGVVSDITLSGMAG